MRRIINDFEIFESIIKNGGWLPSNMQFRERARFSGELVSNAFDLVQVNMAIAAGPNEVSRFEIALLRDDVGEERILGDIKHEADRGIRAPLVKLAG